MGKVVYRRKERQQIAQGGSDQAVPKRNSSRRNKGYTKNKYSLEERKKMQRSRFQKTEKVHGHGIME